mgnify:FL=1
MAAQSLDIPREETPARHYWGGQSRLVYALGLRDSRKIGDHPSEVDLRTVRHAIHALVTAGAIRRVSRAYPGRSHAVYELLPRPVDNSDIFGPGLRGKP